MKNSAIGSNWKDVRAELFTKEEILESDLRVAIMTELIEARHEKGISQKKLERTQWGQSTGHRSDGDRKDQSSIRHGFESLSQPRQDPRRRPTGTRKRSKRNQKELLWKQHKPPSRSTKPCGTQRMCYALRWMPMTISLTFWG